MMTDPGREPSAVVVLVAGGWVLPLGGISSATPCDLGLIERVARLRLAALRLGWTIHLVDVRGDLRALVELAGLEQCLGI